MLRMRNPETILWLERAGLSRVLCQTLIMQRAMERKFGYQQENTSFSFWCGVNESVVGLWNCHVWYARFLTVNACLCCLLLSVIWQGFFSTVCILTLSRTVRGPVVCSAQECSQQGRWLLDWSRYGQCCLRSLENKLSCCGVARANTTPVQLGNVTNDQTNNNNNNTIWGGSVLTGEKPPPHSGELSMLSPKQAAQPNPSYPALCRQDTTSPAAGVCTLCSLCYIF